MSNYLVDRIKFLLKPETPMPLNPGNIDAGKIKGYNKSRPINTDRSSFCYAPSVNMLFAQDGNVRGCCHNMDFSIGKYPGQSIAEIWRSEKAEELRQHMKDWDLKHGCQICAADLQTGNYNEVRATHFDYLPQKAGYPAMMEFLLTNTCNLECVMCRGEYSSLIRKNREKLPPIISPYDKAFLKQLEEFIPHLHETRFSGSGEAFAIDVNYEIWDMILRLNPKCIIMVQTNGSFLNGRIKDLLSRGNFRIGVSLDSLNKETFESIRINANFDKIMENIKYFSEYCRYKKEKFALALCVMRQNWHELPAFINFCNDNNAIATLHKVWFPSEYALNNLSVVELTAIHTYLSQFDFTDKTRLQKTNRQHYHYMVSVIKGWLDEKYAVVLEGTDALGILSEQQFYHYFETRIAAYLATTKIRLAEQAPLVKLCMQTIKPAFAVYLDKIKEVDQMGEAALFNYLESKINGYLIATGTAEDRLSEVTRQCMDKIRIGFARYGNDEGRLTALRGACYVSVAQMVTKLRESNIEQLVEQSKN